MSDDSPDSRCDYTPPLSNISQNQFLPDLPPQFGNVDKKTPESIKFLLKVTQIILDVLWPNSNKPQSHKFVWVLSGDLVQ